MGKPTPREILDSIDPVRRDRAFQLDMLAIDEEFSEQWLHTMRTLIDRNLTADEFTAERMTALHQWTRDRKRAQARLHWKYDRTGKRRPGLVERDVDRAWATLESRIDRLREQLEQRAAQLEAQQTERRQRSQRISDGIHEVHTAAAAQAEEQRAQRIQEVQQLQAHAEGMIRQKLALLPGTMVTGEHVNLFLNMTRDMMTDQDRELFLRTVRGEI
jgi:hypothetical protein